MSNLALSFRISTDAAAALRAIGSVTAQLAAAAGVALSFGAALKKGFEANSEAENVVLGLKGIIASLQDVRDAGGKPAEGLQRLSIAGEEAERQMKLLRVAGMQTSAEFKDLAKAFQTALGAGSGAGLSIDQIRELTVSLTIAAGAFNLAGNQLSSEIRAMLSGEQIDNSQIAQGLGVSGAQIKLWREKGKLVDELNKRLAQFKLLGDEAGKSWSSTLSNLGDGISLFLGQTTKGAFDGIKSALQNALSGAIDQNGNIKAEFQGLADFASQAFGATGELLTSAINGAVEGAKDLSDWFLRNNETVGEIFDSLGRIVGVLNTAAGLVGDMAGQTAGVGSAAKLVNAAFNGVALILAGIVDIAKGLVGVIGYAGAAVASVLLDPLIGVSRVLSNITGKDYTTAIEKVQKETDKFKQAAKDYGMNAFKFDTAKAVAAEIDAAYKASPIHAILNPGSNKATGGTVKAPKAQQSEKAKKDAERAAAAYRDALRAYEDKKAEADKEIAQVARDAALRDLDASLKQRLITQEDYLTKKAALDQKENDQELAAARNREAAIQKQISQQKDPAKKLKLQGDLLKAQADIKALEDKGASIPVALKLQLDEFHQQVASLRIDIVANILDAEGNPYEASVKRLAKETQDLLNDPRVRGNADMEDLVRRQEANKQARLDLDEAKRILDDKAAYTSLTEQRIARDVEAGRMTEIEGDKAVRAEHEKTKAALEEYIAVLEKLAAAYPNNSEFALSLAKARDQLAALNQEVDKTATAINRAFADNVTDSLKQFVSGAETATDAVRNLFYKLFEDIADRALKALGDDIFKALQGMSGGGIGGYFSSMLGGGGFGSFFSGLGSMFGFADGGHVLGPGTGTSDSILARLSNGEFVLKASAVRKWGVGFLNALNAGVMPRTAPRHAFAEGGLVAVQAAQGAGASPVTVQNNNMARLYLDPAHVASEIGQTPQFGRHVIEVIMANRRRLGIG